MGKKLCIIVDEEQLKLRNAFTLVNEAKKMAENVTLVGGAVYHNKIEKLDAEVMMFDNTATHETEVTTETKRKTAHPQNKL